jgi:cytochrome c oxidase subunit 3/cytochrome o ubiquinol oxidase subunit 3
MSTIPVSANPENESWTLPYRGTVGMASVILAESSMFLMFVVGYLFYMGKSTSGPTPDQVLEPPWLITICLWASSLTIHLSVEALRKRKQFGFMAWLGLTILLGVIFIAGTGREWWDLIFDKGLTIRTNLFGTTFYSLVGLHSFHVIVGLLMLGTVFLIGLFKRVGEEHHGQFYALSIYWHFVDAVWVVVFSVVYIIGR